MAPKQTYNPKKKGLTYWLSIIFCIASVCWIVRRDGSEGSENEPSGVEGNKPRRFNFFVLLPLVCLVLAAIVGFMLYAIFKDLGAISTLGAIFVLVAGFFGAYRSLGNPRDSDNILQNEYAYLTFGGAFLVVKEVFSFIECWLSGLLP